MENCSLGNLDRERAKEKRDIPTTVIFSRSRPKLTQTVNTEIDNVFNSSQAVKVGKIKEK